MPYKIKDKASVDLYVSRVMDLRAALENLQEFVGTLPAPDDDNEIPGMDYAMLGSLGRMLELIGEASGTADELND